MEEEKKPNRNEGDATSPSGSAGQRKSRKARKGKKRTVSSKSLEGGKRGGGPRPFPGETLEEALRVPTAIKQFNAGNPWSPAEVANALGVSARGDKMWYLTASARDYGLTLGTRDTDTIELGPIGRDLLYAASPDAEKDAAWRSFFNVSAFKSVYEYYKGGALPDLKYLQNTLEATFSIPTKYHDDFVRIFTANVQFVERYGGRPTLEAGEHAEVKVSAHSIIVGEPKDKTSLVSRVLNS